MPCVSPARALVARLAAGLGIALGVLFVAPPAWAAPAAPTTNWESDDPDYYSSPFFTGDKELGTTIELEMEDGRHPPCNGGSNLQDTFWFCNIPPSYFWPRPDPLDNDEVIAVRAVDALGARSDPAFVTAILGESRLAITTPPDLPSGDVVELDGDREFGTSIEWTIDGPSGPIFEVPRVCEVSPDIEDRWFTCTYDSNAGASGRRRGVAMVVPDGTYSATFREFQGVTQIAQIVFNFTVGTPIPPPAPPTPPMPTPPTSTPTSTPTPTPTPTPTVGPGDPDDPTPPDPSGGSGGGGTTSPTDDSDPASDPTSAPSADPSADPSGQPTPSADPTEAPSDNAVEPEEVVTTAAPTLPDVDILPWLILAVLLFTIMGTLGMPGLALGGRFAPGSTRTGGGQVPVGRWPSADVDTARATGTHRQAAVGLLGLTAGEVGAADEAVDVSGRTAEGWGDRSFTWRAPGHGPVDALVAALPVRLAPRWPLLARLAEDGTPVRAVLGSLSLLLPAAGLVLGVVAGLQADGPYAPGFALTAVLVGIGLADALAGLVSVLGFTAAVLLAGGLTVDGLTTGQGLRGLVGVAALWFVVPLVAGAARPFRRIRAAGHVYPWDRLGDAVIAALLSAWAVQGLVGSLDDLVGRPQPLTPHADAVALTTLALVAARFGLEEVAARGYPQRLGVVHRGLPPTEPSFLVQLRGVLVRSGFLAFFAWAFLGSCWQLWAGVAVFTLPYALALVHQRIPDARPVALTVPRGVVETLVLVLVGTALAYWIDAGAGDDPTRALRTGFVVLAVPAAVIGVLGVLGGEPPAQRWTWPRQLAGAAVVALSVAVVLVWL
jgi:hypothetical protein